MPSRSKLGSRDFPPVERFAFEVALLERASSAAPNAEAVSALTGALCACSEAQPLVVLRGGATETTAGERYSKRRGLGGLGR